MKKRTNERKNNQINNETKHQPLKIEDEAQGKERKKQKTITSSYEREKNTSLVHCSIFENSNAETVCNTKK